MRMYCDDVNDEWDMWNCHGVLSGYPCGGSSGELCVVMDLERFISFRIISNLV